MADVKIDIRVDNQVTSGGGVRAQVLLENNENDEVEVRYVVQTDEQDPEVVESAEYEMNPMAATSFRCDVPVDVARKGLTAYVDYARAPGEPNVDHPDAEWPDWMKDV